MGITDMMNRVQLSEEERKKYIHFSSHRYTRVLVSYNEHYSLMLICWDKGQGTPIHDHGDDRTVWWKVIEGCVRLTIYENESVHSEQCSIEDGVTVEDRTVVHKLENCCANQVAVSLHLYVPAYLECCFRDPTSGAQKTVPVVYCPYSTDEQLKDTACRLSIQSRIFSNFQAFIETLRSEFNARDAPDASHIKEIVECFQFNPEEWKQYARFDPQHYSRVLVAQDKAFSVILCCWNVKQVSPIHDHYGSKAWVKVLSGTMEEAIYSFDEKLHLRETVTLDNQTTCHRDGDLIHSIKNIGECEAVTLHIYSPPFQYCNCYDCCANEVKKTISIDRIFEHMSPCMKRRQAVPPTS